MPSCTPKNQVASSAYLLVTVLLYYWSLLVTFPHPYMSVIPRTNNNASLLSNIECSTMSCGRFENSKNTHVGAAGRRVAITAIAATSVRCRRDRLCSCRISRSHGARRLSFPNVDIPILRSAKDQRRVESKRTSDEIFNRVLMSRVAIQAPLLLPS